MSPSPSPPATPSRAADALLDLVQQMTPSKPPEVLRRDVSSLKRRITDLENLAATTLHPKKQRKPLNHAAHTDDSIANPQTIEDRTCEQGRKFLVQEALFLVDPDIFTAKEEEDFDPINKFTSDKNKIQGQLRQILCYLPDNFTDGMDGQRSTTSNRLHGQSLVHIVDDVKAFASSALHVTAFTELISYQPGTEARNPYVKDSH
ncbi:hypothetical protein DFH09DRAFT_1087721 [Mycena vulgaris]|nr:hypothetical protein DFH09DRAFT_1087721 [Mycena vulgaris]